MAISKRVVLHFPPSLVEEPMTYVLVKKFNVMFNILKARVSVDDGEGALLLELTGTERNMNNSLAYLKRLGVKTETLDKDLVRADEKCVQCGICALVCPTNAFSITAREMTLNFDAAKCIGCDECRKSCPYGAIKTYFP
jgi:ferredoxin